MIDLVLVLGGVAIGAAATWYRARQRERKLLDAEQATALALQESDAKSRFLERRLKLRDRQLTTASKQRDDYAAIAKTHEIVTPRWGAGEWARKVWKDRRFSGHPEKNLTDLVHDFAQFGDQHVLVALDIELLGGWKQLLGAPSPGTSITTPLSAGDTLLFEGPGPRVLEQLITFVRDDDTGFYTFDDDGVGSWRDGDSPMVWRLTVDVLHGEPPKDAEFVEVLRVEERIVEQIIEKPVLRTVPADVATSLSRHTREEIITLVEAVLEVRELGLNERVEAQRALLPEDLKRTAELPPAPSAPDSDNSTSKA